jgi:hypothetical protein
MRHFRAWKVAPFLLLAVGVFGFLRLTDHYAWSGGVTVLIGVLLLALFVVILGPLAVAAEVSRQREELLKGSVELLDALVESAHKTSSTTPGVKFRVNGD